MISLYISLVRSYLSYALQFWLPNNTKNIAKLEVVQRRATKIITSSRNKSYRARLALLDLARETTFSRKT